MSRILPAEYKDIWDVEHTRTRGDKLKANFVRKRKEVVTNNHIIEDFLQESVIMKQFSHINVLSLIGVSVHNNKPCIILPLMSNGDLNRYLRKHEKVNGETFPASQLTLLNLI